jgi:nifR3 family TIM-barrel protein
MNIVSLLKSVHIHNLVTSNNLFLAPLAGIGDTAFRIVGRRFGAGLVFSEMVSANGIVRGNLKTRELMRIDDRERPLGIQIFGSEPVVMAEAAAIAAEQGPDLIDINCGCSVKKVLKTGSGAALLGDPDRFFRVVRGCVRASDLPVSVKVRLGLREESVNVVEIGRAAEEAGAALLTLHARTAAAKYTGHAQWEYIALLKEAVAIPVCGNGDVRSGGDAIAMIGETGCDAVMVGRGAIGNPWLLRELVVALERGDGRGKSEVPSVRERVECALEHLDLAISFKGERRAVRDMKRHLHRYIRGIRDAAWIRERLFRAESAEQMLTLLRQLVSPGA